ncbi:MAG: hypothetical protein J6Q49_00060 [Kiritimatiellae bacterium]|nr:hypothetical protein [Kiritimatiellia bacterium]
MRKSVVIAEALCLVGAAAIGLIYSDRLNRERERREHIEATGAKALSTVRELQGNIRRFSSKLDLMVAEGEKCFASATNKVASLRRQWEKSMDGEVRQILAEAESKLAEEGTQLVAAREAKARVKSALEPLVSELAEIEGMSITNAATLAMVVQRVVDCSDSFNAVKQSQDIAAIVGMSSRFRSHVDAIVMDAAYALHQKVIIYDPAPQTVVDNLLDEKEDYIVRGKIESVMSLHVLGTLQWEKFKGMLLEAEKDVANGKRKALLHDALFKIDLMESVHKLFAANAKDVVFHKGKLKGCEVLSSDGSGLRLLSSDKKKEECISWQVFYARYHSNMNELVVGLIEKARTSGKTADGVGFNDESWACAMLGAALSFVHICGDDPTACVRAEQLAKAAVGQCPTIRAKAERAFPNVSFDIEDGN